MSSCYRLEVVCWPVLCCWCGLWNDERTPEIFPVRTGRLMLCMHIFQFRLFHACTKLTENCCQGEADEAIGAADIRHLLS